VQARTGEQRDEDCVDVPTIVAPDEEPVLSAEHLAAEVELADVVVQGQSTVVEEAPECGPLVAGVAKPGLVSAIQLFHEQIASLAPQLPDYDLFCSLPGAGAALAPRLLVAFDERRERFPNAASPPEVCRRRSHH
jgi:hypothetical protein